MNAKLLLKTLFLILILLLLVLRGMYNRSTVDFTLPRILSKAIQQPAARREFAFYAAGVRTGTNLTAGTGGAAPKRRAVTSSLAPCDCSSSS
jgi:hypothetical protein